MNYKNITVAGSGILGYQVAFQIAFHGFKVSVYDINDEVLAAAKKKFDLLSKAYKKDLQATQKQLDATFKNLSYSSDLAVAVKDADLLIEAIPETSEIKIAFYEKLSKLAPEKTVFATNSSTLLPSEFAEATGRPKQFIALHFANEIWKHNTAEIMGHVGTSKEVFKDVVEFSKAIGMIALPLFKEQPGYILNSLLVPLLRAGVSLWGNEVADAQTIDKTWMVATGAPKGPFGIIDIVGLTTVYNIHKMHADGSEDPLKQKVIEKLKEMIDAGKLGAAVGEGFYKYPNPEYLKADFLK